MSNYTVVNDTYIASANPDTNYGSNATLLIGYFGGIRRSLLKYDFSTIPSTAIVVGATFHIYLNSELSNANSEASLYSMKVSWVEGEATWNKRDSVNDWTEAGAFSSVDCSQLALGSISLSSTESAGWKSFLLEPKEIQRYIDGASTNYGFLLKTTSEVSGTNNGYTFSSLDGSYDPYIEIEYVTTTGTYIRILRGDTSTVEDTYLKSNDASANFYSEATIDVGDLAGTEVKRSLIKFDLSSVPSIANIKEAYLLLYLSHEASNNATNLNVYRLKVNYDADFVSWNQRNIIYSWNPSGAFGTNDCEQTEIGTLALTSTEADAYKSISLTASKIEEYLNGTTTNNGFLLKAETENANSYYFDSTDAASPITYPRLALSYDYNVVTLSVQDTSQNQSSDNIVFSDFTYADDYILRTQYFLKNYFPLYYFPLEAESQEFVIQNSTSLQTVDNLELVQHFSLLVDNSNHSIDSDNTILTQHQSISINSASHLHISDNISVVQHQLLIVDNSSHVQTSENISLIQHQILTISNCTHIQTSNNLELIQNQVLLINNTSHLQVSTTIELVQHQILSIQNTLHNQITDNITIGGIDVVSDSSSLSHNSDVITLVQHQILSVDNSELLLNSNNILLIQHQVISINNSTQVHSVENIELTQHQILFVNNTLHNISSTNIELIAYTEITLTIANSILNQYSENIALVQHQIISVQNSTQLLTSEELVLFINFILEISNVVHLQSAISVSLVQHQVLDIFDNILTLQTDNIILIYHAPTFEILINNCEHLTSSTLVELLQHQLLHISGDLLLQVSNELNLVQHNILNINNSIQEIISSQIIITPRYSISVINTLHSQNSENCILIQHQILNVSNVIEYQLSDNITFVYIPPSFGILNIQTPIQLQTSDNLVILPKYEIVPVSAIHNQFTDTLDLIQHYILIVLSAYLFNYTDNVVLLHPIKEHFPYFTFAIDKKEKSDIINKTDSSYDLNKSGDIHTDKNNRIDYLVDKEKEIEIDKQDQEYNVTKRNNL